MNLTKRKSSFATAPRNKWSLREALRCIGVDCPDLPQASHLKRAHRIFRKSGGNNVEINGLWTRIKKHICPICEGPKYDPNHNTCGLVCREIRRKLIAGRALLFVALSVQLSAFSQTNQFGTQEIRKPLPKFMSSKSQPAVLQSPRAASAAAVPLPRVTENLSGAAQIATGVVTVSAPGQQARITLRWDPSPDASVVGYRLYYGPAFGNYTNSTRLGNVTNATLSNLPEGARLYFTATAYDAGGVESVFSNVVTNDLPWFVSLRPAADYIEGYGRAGATNVIEVSTNLTTWTTLKTFVGTGRITNAIWWRSNAPAAFFRTRTK